MLSNMAKHLWYFFLTLSYLPFNFLLFVSPSSWPEFILAKSKGTKKHSQAFLVVYGNLIGYHIKIFPACTQPFFELIWGVCLLKRAKLGILLGRSFSLYTSLLVAKLLLNHVENANEISNLLAPFSIEMFLQWCDHISWFVPCAQLRYPFPDFLSELVKKGWRLTLNGHL